MISIIVPVYNGEAYIDRCVQSVLAQEYRDFELILVDGASTDSTLSRCRVWQKRDDRVSVIHTPINRGVSAGRNKGMEKARGEFVFFLDADDWLLPDCLMRLFGQMKDARIDIAGCAFSRCTNEDWDRLAERIRAGGAKEGGSAEAGADVYGPQAPPEMPQDAYTAEYGTDAGGRLIAGRDFLQEGILRQDTRCWSKLYRRSLIEGHLFRRDFTIGEDMLFLWEVAAEANLISSSDYPGYCYYCNPGGTMLRRFRKSDMDQIRCWQLVLESLQRDAGKTGNDTSVISECATILLISCMLVAGKLALLPAWERRQHKELRRQCGETLAKTMAIPGAYKGLDRGYRIKTMLFRYAPEVYLFLYHLLKKNK